MSRLTLTAARAIRACVLFSGTLLALAPHQAPALAAQAQPPAPTPAPTTGACHVSPIVDNLDKAAHFYHDLLGLNLVPEPPPGPLPWDTNPGHLHLHGMPQAKLRFIGARMPGVFCGVELVEFANIDRRPVHRRLQDPGAVTLILLVRDLGGLFARLKEAGVPVVTAGGAPMVVGTAKTRVVIVKDPDGHFVELAQLDPLPQTTPAGSSNVIDIRLRVTVPDTERAADYYRRMLGIDPKISAFTKNEQVMAMMGLPAGAEYRLSTAQVPGSALLLEFLELKGLESTRIASRVQDPGSYRLQLNVPDIESTIRRLKGAGGSVISTGGEPVSMTFGTRPWRLAVATDLNNLFLILQQRLP
jgi:catechol 2,3-dioxygenase-like lactoylglutathione lyase family enzyme